MKRVFLLAVFFSFTSFAANLLPAGHFTCLNKDSTECPRGTQLLFDDQGRCNCFSKTDFFDADFCMRAHIVCDEGQSFEALYAYRNMCGMIQKVNVGCGCFNTAEPEVYPF